ncbi:hypothetical protein SAMN04487905_105285 [Actinopolyspora xinjiangensis]|uniref:Uncharacterized protein n=1 Tax=Actinopolyspora xinjiangensis TaxID=405564 RepID=A0A1H0TU21_9ACTN|nr:hypothetical protein [Actinopolyspora xinjiangensis]SDP57547.1 hypothetical protein SAMN04487905_105285 [Actinopolyspora xinjiangensis]
MIRVGITGHSSLTPRTREMVRAALRTTLRPHVQHGLHGVTCLARGADQLFAHAVRDVGGSYEVVLPADDYRDAKVKPDDLPEFDTLVEYATTVHIMPFSTSGRAAYQAASAHILDTVDWLVAVWDGQPSDGAGGTGDTVAAARERGLPVTVVWPEGAARD